MTVSSGSPIGGALPEVFDRYRPDGSALFEIDRLAHDGTSSSEIPFDEMLDSAGRTRTAWTDLVDGYAARGEARLHAAAARLATAVSDEGVVYNQFDGVTTVARDWQIDPVPLIVDGSEWSELEKAVTQRSMLLDLLLRDLYRDQKTITSGLIPPEMVFGHPGYIRKAARLEVPGPHGLFLHALDLVRSPEGRFEVYADRTQAPSGIGFAIVDRRLLSRTFPQLFQQCAPRAMTSFAGTLRLALFDYAPPGVDDPTVAVLSPGSMSETAFDQAYLASVLGLPLVEGTDLTVRDGVVYMRSLGKFKRVDVLLRRIDAEYADPLDLRTDSRLGVAGLVEAISRGNVTVVNTLGSGVLENPAMHTVLERLAPVLLDEELALPSVPTLWAGDDLQRGKILADLDDLVITDIRSGDEYVMPLIDSATRAHLRDRIESQTWQWVARTLRPTSMAPSMTAARGGFGAATLRAAPVGVRAFSVAQGPTYAVLPGGLGSVLADGPAGSAHHVAAAKDVWVTSADVGGHVSRKSSTRAAPDDDVLVVPAPGRPTRTGYSDIAAAASPRVLSDLFWFGRYGERVESTTRLAKVARERYQEVQYRPWMSGPAAVPMILHATAIITGTARYLDSAALLADDADTAPTADRVDEAIATITDLTVARAVPGTIAHSIDRLVSSARAVRDQMSTSTWMVLAPVERAIERLGAQVRADRLGVDEVSDSTGHATDSGLEPGSELRLAHDEVLHGVLALAGLQAESMVHDAGWLFMDIGRRIERALTLADLTRALFVDHHDREVEQALLESYLVANESSVIYRRRNRGLYQFGAVGGLLFFDESNPRSLIYQLTLTRADLAALPDELRSAAAERIVEDLIAELRRSDPDDLATPDAEGRRPDLADLMTTIGTGLRELSDVLGRTKFAPPRQAQPIWGGGGEDAP
ncbi:circularly permuted type 2 ATP-grasp protein [Gordonia sp. OPL2]|uniref:circularly permuted type 2 ATP-grasp protein n=1 Tax=Gordonia sp. OPL2 TaxID=2486274 RepID=UPI0021CCC0EA|nr:circularly permuted type 2 ATP-grasp protein [Gordonia sp. OPL2]